MGFDPYLESNWGRSKVNHHHVFSCSRPPFHLEKRCTDAPVIKGAMGNGLSLQKKTIQKLFLRSHGSHGKFLEANSYPTDLRISKRFGNSNHPRRYTVTNIYISLYIHIYIYDCYIYILVSTPMDLFRSHCNIIPAPQKFHLLWCRTSKVECCYELCSQNMYPTW